MNPKKYVIDLIKDVAYKNNYHVIADWDIASYPLAQLLKKLFSLYKIDCVLDVGANIGQYRDFLRNMVGYNGLILSFEPVRHIAQSLKERSSEDPLWEVFDVALGKSNALTRINVTKAPSRNSLLDPRTDVVKDFWSSDAVSRTEEVSIQTIDDFLKQRDIDCSKYNVYLKMDTQGFDLEVAKGALTSLKYIKALQTEASIRPIYHGMPNYQETISFMNDLGFDIAGMFWVSGDDTLRMVEFDCVMVNSTCEAV